MGLQWEVEWLGRSELQGTITAPVHFSLEGAILACKMQTHFSKEIDEDWWNLYGAAFVIYWVQFLLNKCFLKPV